MADSGRSGIFSTYNRDPVIDFLSSSAGIRISSYTASSYDLTADSDGNKFIQSGTVMMAVGTATYPKCAPRTGSNVAIGICTRTANLREGDTDVGLLRGGWVNESRLWDDGTHGAVDSSVKTDLPEVHFDSHSG